MDPKLTKLRGVLRGQFTKKVKLFESLLEAVPVDINAITSIYKHIQQLHKELLCLNNKIVDILLHEAHDDDVVHEVEDADRYMSNFFHVETNFESLTRSTPPPTSLSSNRNKRNLPTLQIPKFTSEVKQWLPFWAQFRKIHDDVELSPEDKFIYLIQSISEGTEARDLVESYPISAANYGKCIEHLKERYGREDLQTQLYVRELLSIVINREAGRSLTTLFDKISAQLRSLETLGVTKKNAAFLLPMVESALPESCLRAWQRSSHHGDGMEAELCGLLEFLKGEVENEQRMKIAQTGTIFTTDTPTCQGSRTAECLVAVDKSQKECIWCGKSNHNNFECFKLGRLSLEDRRKILSEKKACTICLKPGHFYQKCKSNIKCLICSKKHSTAICKQQISSKKVTEEQRTPLEKTSTTTTSTSSKSSSSETTLLQTVVVELQHKGKTIPVRALFDSGSQRTYITEKIATCLQLPVIGEEILRHSVFGGNQTSSKKYNNYKFKITSMDHKYSVDITALGHSVICNNVPKVKPSASLLKILRNNNIVLTDLGGHTEDIGLLIGADCSGMFLMEQITHLGDTGLVAIQTKLGWTLQGKQVSNCVSNITTSLFCSNSDNILTGFWSLETIGIRDPAEMKSKEIEANEVMAAFNESVRINEEGRYEVRLPFKPGYEELLPNYFTAKKRLESTTQKLISGGKFHNYNETFQEWFDMGIIEKVPDSDMEHNKGHYLPHRAVIKESSLTSSLRPVFDASARDKNNLSLNACLEKGINMIDLIPNLLIGFRTGVIGVSSDIQKAFLQISLPPEDRDYLKFLWWEDESLQKIITYRHCRLVFGLTSSPFLLAATLSHHLKNTMSPNAELLKRSWYVDNCLTSLDTEQETLSFIQESKQIMEAAGFNLRMWVTSQLGINETGKEVISVLGLSWNTVNDELYCNIGNLPDPDDIQNITKRELLSLTQKIWDPIGYSTPVMLVPKLILQEIWRKELRWDDNIPAEQMVKFIEWYKELSYLRDCKIPRRLTEDKIKDSEVSLHLFCDASKDGYAAGVVLRAQKGCNVTVQLIMAKARVTPPKNISIPRKELLATLIGSRMLAQIKENVNFKDCPTYCWTDSSVVLCWIKRQLALNNFVGNRVKEIRQNTNINDWRHIPGADNWIDLASRGCTAKALYESRWWEGPEWLRWTPDRWPRSEVIVNEREVLAETKKTVCNAQVSLCESLLVRLQKRISKFTKLVRTLAWIQRFVHNIKHTNNKKKGELTFNEYGKAEKKIIGFIQEDSKDHMEKEGKNLTKYRDDDGLIRVKTKLTLSDFPESTRAPYLLIGKNPVTKLIVRQRHEELQHAGRDQLIVDLRTRFWIVGARRVVRSVISNCIICKRHSSKPCQAPTAPLPRERIISAAPWQNTGVDLAGPLMLRNGEKVWIILYTCAVYRAVSLDITRSLSTEAFIMSLRRFIARRGRMDLIISDNGTNFQGTKSLLANLDWEEVQRFSSIRRIRWRMNAPSAAWWGGFFERLIKTMKELLRKILGNASLSYDELLTTLCECEMVMNGRPLTYINDDKNNYLEPLTPSHFILPANQPVTEVSDLDLIDNKSLNNRLKYIQSLREQFNERFKSEYLTLLIQRGKETQTSLKEGDIVLIETPEKRIKWPLGVIQKFIPGRDGVERTAEVKTALGSRIRPVQRLYSLEVPSSNISSYIPSHSSPTPGQVADETNQVTSDADKNENSGNKGKLTPSYIIDPSAQQSSRGRQIKIPSKFNIYQRY